MYQRLMLLLLFFMVVFNAKAQLSPNKMLFKAEKHFNKLDYSPALKAYKSVLQSDPTNTKALDGIVRIYMDAYELYDSAEVYINRQLKLLSSERDTNYRVYYDYANCLRLQEKHEEAIKVYKFFKRHGIKNNRSADPILLELNKNITYCLNAMNNMEKIYEPFWVENMDFFINSVEAEYTPVYLEEDNWLLYNARYKDYDEERRDKDNLFFENIYYFDLDESVASTYNPRIEQVTHQSIVSKVFDTDSILVFYKNKIWLSSMNEGRLNELEPLPKEFGSHYFQPHGVFSKDQKSFIFSARTEEGNLDLFVSHFSDNNWSEPVPLSIRINSSEDEDGPYLSADGKTLYFSSKGHNSSGGYDFYVSKKVNGEWTTPENMGYPMNSAGDDIYISWDSKARGGFFSSNRNGGFGSMDVYRFGLIKKTIRGAVKDNDGNPLADVDIKITDLEKGLIATVKTNENGDYSFLVDPERKFEIKGSKEGYFGDANSLDTYGEEDIIISNLSLEKDPGISLYIKVVESESNQPLDSVKIILQDNMIDVRDSTLTDQTGEFIIPLPNKKLDERGSYNITLKKKGYLAITETYNVLFDHEGQYDVLQDLQIKMEKIDVGADLTDIINLNPIYFDYNSAVIRPDAAIELDKIVRVMNDNPDMIIELGSHTDSRGSKKGNQRLSERRAKASAKYIKERITNPDRITGKGYGESKLVNDCADGVECTEIQHQKNRRTEFIIIEM